MKNITEIIPDELSEKYIHLMNEVQLFNGLLAEIKKLEKALEAIKKCESKGQARRIAIQALAG